MAVARKVVGYSCLSVGMAGIVVGLLVLLRNGDLELAPYFPAFAAILFVGGLAFMAGLGLLMSTPGPSNLRPMRAISWQWLLGGVACVAISIWCSTALLLSVADDASNPADRTKLKFDALKTSLTVGAGAAGAVALVLAFRRQWLNERSQSHLEYDAREQRVTNLYTKAADQLGHEKAAVRLAGLYALERVAQDNPEHRQTIVNVICAYLRMPLPHRETLSNPANDYSEDREPPKEILEARREHDEELHVREAAQTIITKHLKSTTDGTAEFDSFWPDVDLDLRKAYLRDFTLDGCSLRGADFSGATFQGGIFVARTSFSGTPRGKRGPFGIGGADFASSGDASFTHATFGKRAYLGGVDFQGKADFSGATFKGYTNFEGSTFHDGAKFAEARFGNGVSFDSAGIYVEGARFTGFEADFTEAEFGGSVSFAEAKFEGKPISDQATANGANFTGASAGIGGDIHHVWPTGWREGDETEPGYVAIVRDEEPTSADPKRADASLQP
jgi:uncharacterized protein YjbI with pentapeptide repeats